MIIGERPSIFDGEVFASGLTRALKAVVRIFIGEEASVGTCSGWMLTPRIAILPAYSFQVAAGKGDAASVPVSVQASAGGSSQWQERVKGGAELLGGDGAAGDKALTVALVALEKARRIPRLDLCTSVPDIGSGVSLLSFPGGKPRVGLSLGTLLSVGELSFDYDADSEPGSGGAPVFDERWQILGMHMSADRDARRNRAVGRAAIVDMLRRSRHWDEIAGHHRLADLTAGLERLKRPLAGRADTAPDPVLIEAALRLKVLPRGLSEPQRTLLRDSVVDASAREWTLQAGVRQKVIRAVGSLEALRAHAPRRAVGTGQRVIAKVLAGPPYELDRANEEELAWWIQAARWFADVAPALPKPADVSLLLERRRVRGRLVTIAGEDFQGRKHELETLRSWFAGEPPVPISVSGVGGVGKSALVARFAAALPPDTLLLWLDFDRADLAPDDAASIIAALDEQARVQLSDFEVPQGDSTDWKAEAAALADAVAARQLGHPPLLVLDSFEVAQYAERYNELWPVIEEVAARLPALRVIVSGRAPVTSLRLSNREARHLPLTGLRPADARLWLQRHKIRNPRIVDRVVRLSAGLPLVLHLAHRLVAAGGSVARLPTTLPPAILAGFLYGRILDRVQSPALKPLAMASLVVRRLTEDMLQPVFAGVVAVPPGQPADWFRELAREAALVDGTTVLTLRPELRSAALVLLERDQKVLVRAVDRGAAAWFASQDVNDPRIAAELVYHRLRLGDLEGAAAAWRDGCGIHLQYAEESLKGAARSWLRDRLGAGSVAASAVDLWEQEAAERIRSSRSRDLKRSVSGILGERQDRSDHSALAFHAAYELRAEGDKPAALQRLEAAGDDLSGPIGRERALLRALLLVELERRQDAAALLRPLDSQERWSDRREGSIEHAALCAARVRLATDFAAELALIQLMQGKSPPPAADWICPIDAMLPKLERMLAQRSLSEERLWTVAIPGDSVDRSSFASAVEEFRAHAVPDEPAELRSLRRLVDQGELLLQAAVAPPGLDDLHQRARRGELLTADRFPASVPSPAREVLACGWQRWAIAASSPLFSALPQLASEGVLSPILASIAGSMALFASPRGLSLELGPGFGARRQPLNTLIDEVIARNKRWSAPSSSQFSLLVQGFDALHADENVQVERGRWTSRGFQRRQAVNFHLNVPDPLELLVDRFAGKERVEA